MLIPFRGDDAENSTKFVELTPRSAITEKVTSAIKLKDGRSVPVGDKSARPPPPPVPAGKEAAIAFPPPGNFNRAPLLLHRPHQHVAAACCKNRRFGKGSVMSFFA